MVATQSDINHRPAAPGQLRRYPGSLRLRHFSALVHIPPGGRVAFEAGARDVRVQQQVWVLQGTIEVAVGPAQHRSREGDRLAIERARPTLFHNPGRKPARHAVVSASEPAARR